MPEEKSNQSHCAIKLDGARLPDEVHDQMLDCTVENSLHLPDVCTIRLHDASFKLLDANTFKEGKRLEVSGGDEASQLLPIFDGEICDLEMDLAAHGTPTLVVRAYDRSNRLHRGRNTNSFVQMKDSDIVKKVGAAAGFNCSDVEETSVIHDWVMQNNLTDWEFLTDRARRNGYRLYVKEKDKLCFKKVKADEASAEIQIEWGKDLRSFRPRVSAGEQVNEVIVQGWDSKNKEKIVGEARSPNGVPRIGEGRNGGQVAQQAFHEAAKMVIVDRPVHSTEEAENLARSVMDEIGGGFVEADGLCFGKPQLKAGTAIQVKNVGTRFSGKYLLTSVTHTFTPAEGYATLFSVTGKRPATLLGLLDGSGGGNGRQGNGGGMGSQVVIALVTDNNDPEGRGRVKVKYPWLDENHASYWARVVAPMGGHRRGFLFIPEVDDEVLVVLEHGDLTRPYVVGAVWSGKDEVPPGAEDGRADYTNGQVFRRTIHSRNGNIIEMDDDHPTYGTSIVLTTPGKRKMRLSDKDQNIVLMTNNGHTMRLDDAKGEVHIQDQGGNQILIKTSGSSIEISANGPIDMKAKGKVTIEGLGGVDIKSPAQVNVDGSGGVKVSSPATVQVQGQAATQVSSSGIVTVQGSLVKIN